MMNSKIILTSVAIAVFSSTSANAGNYVTLGSPAKKDVILSLGEAPVKKKIDLNLGDLRKDEVDLPAGALSLFDRMKMRAKRATDRHKAVASAHRRRVKAAQAKKSFVETDNNQSSGDNGMVGEPVIQ